MTHRDTLPRVSASSVGCSDAAHRKAHATPSETLGKAPFPSHERPLGGRRKVSTMGNLRQLPSYPRGRSCDLYGLLSALLGIRRWIVEIGWLMRISDPCLTGLGRCRG